MQHSSSLTFMLMTKMNGKWGYNYLLDIIILSNTNSTEIYFPLAK
jgi:hypothetical protein